MMEVVRFIFSTPWTFLGTAFLIATTGYALKTAFKGLRGLIKITFKSN